MSKPRDALVLGAAFAAACALAPFALAADRRVETAAKDAITKAANDYRAADYAAGANRLRHALRACGASKCAPATRALLRRALRVMQARGENVEGAGQTWDEALESQPNLAPNKDSETADRRPAREEASATAEVGAQGGGSSSAPPTEDLAPPPGDRGTAPPPLEIEASETSAAEKPYARLWVGVAAELPEFLQMPGGDDLCKLTSTLVPANSVGAYCTNPDGTDFPSRASSVQNSRLSESGQEGHSGGGVHAGDVRVMAAFDYALSASWLIGARVGYVLNAYPGQAAVLDRHALGPKIHAEGRATHLFGHAPLATIGFAPMAFAGAGVSEFDGHVTSVVTLDGVAGQQSVNIWVTDAPFFVTLGGGFRYQFSLRAAFTAAARLNAVIGGNGLLLTYGPEVGVLYGF